MSMIRISINNRFVYQASLNQRPLVWLICKAHRTIGTESGFLLTPRRVLAKPGGRWLESNPLYSKNHSEMSVFFVGSHAIEAP